MRRHIPGLNTGTKNAEDLFEGLFLVRVDRVNYQWHTQKPYFLVRFTVLEPAKVRSRCILGRLYCTPKALWRLRWFLRDFGYDADLLGRDEVDEKALQGLKGIIRTSRKALLGHSILNLDGFAPTVEWERLSIEGRAGIQSEKKVSHGIQLHTD
jgi:hypothetical protein